MPVGAHFSKYAEQKIVNHIFGGPDYAQVGTYYMQLYLEGTGEPAAPSYARAEIPNNGTFWVPSGPNNTQRVNAQPLKFPVAQESWGNINRFSLVILPVGVADSLGFGVISPTLTINAGMLVEFPPGSIIVTTGWEI